MHTFLGSGVGLTVLKVGLTVLGLPGVGLTVTSPSADDSKSLTDGMEPANQKKKKKITLTLKTSVVDVFLKVELLSCALLMSLISSVNSNPWYRRKRFFKVNHI